MSLRKFSEIVKLAEKHHGKAGLQKRLAEHSGEAAKQSDDRYLAGMTKEVFSAGLSWELIERKWANFETAFECFDPHRVAFYTDRDIARLMDDASIIHSFPKIQATINNAHFIVETAKKHGSFGAFLQAWPANDQFGLMEHLTKNASHLGPISAMYFLRFNGWDAFILSRDVNKALIREKVIGGVAHSKANMRAVQSAFNKWTAETGLPQRDVSRILAFSVGPSA